VSDLQCPARVVLATSDVLPSLVGERYSGVFAAAAVASDARALAAATAFAQQVNCELERIDAAVDAPAFKRALDELSDVYRGEAIVAVAPLAMIREVVGRAADAAKPLFVEIDSSGWSLR
jgi:hypothetical protein